MDSVETTLRWEDQFLEMDQLNNSSSDDENYLHENFKYILRVKSILLKPILFSILLKSVLDLEKHLLL